MRVLLIKTSSMGDIIHTLPALTDAGCALPGIQFDWVVEKAFADIPSMHPLVNKVIPIALRSWRRRLVSFATWSQWQSFKKELQASHYDAVLDAQALIKSAFLMWFAKGTRLGLDWLSAREPLAAFMYERRFTVNFYQHAVIRMRSLFAKALGYEEPISSPDFGLMGFSHEYLLQAKGTDTKEPYIVFLHGTTWTSKQWPEIFWRELAYRVNDLGYKVKMSGYTFDEQASAARIADQHSAIDVLPPLGVREMIDLILGARGVVTVDTGFGHLAAAFDVPTVSLYGATDPVYTGAVGKHSTQLAADFSCAPCLRRECRFQSSLDAVTPACYATIPPEQVSRALEKLLA